MSITLLARDTDTCIGHCHGSDNGLCPLATRGAVRCAGLRLRVTTASPTLPRSWTLTVREDATSCPAWLGGRAGIAR